MLYINKIFYRFSRKINFYREWAWQKKTGVPSEKCLEAWYDYYTQSHKVNINISFFKDMIKNWGTPDWSNPFPPATKEYYEIHHQGFLVWDIEKIIMPISPPGTLKEDCFDEIGNKLTDEQIKEKGRKRFIRENNIKNACIDCIGILLAENCSIKRTALIMNNYDLKALVGQVVIFGRYDWVGYNHFQVLQGAYNQNLIDKDDYHKFLKARLETDPSIRDEVELPPEPDKYNPDLPKLNIKK